MSVSEVSLSIVVPCRNEADNIPLFLNALEEESESKFKAHNVSLDVLLVDDGSTDSTLQVMQEQASSNRSVLVNYISLSRNFGKEAAMYAGLASAKGDYVAVMDADMQDPPSLLFRMYETVSSGSCDNVATRRYSRKGEPPIRSFFSKLFYRVINAISQTEIVDGARDYRLMNRKMVDAILELSERNRFSKGIFSWVGFKTEWISYENIERTEGNSSWSFWSLILYAVDGIAAFSTVPLSMASVLGLLFCMIALLTIVFVVVRAALFGDPVAGWPSLICVVLLVGGIQLLCLGVIGQYLAKTYIEVKRRPLFVVAESSLQDRTNEKRNF
ncbi:glycosyltransferase family 2 protein [Gordonibacter massiliensis (ex Traore et al. 2017)]|uniref:glycosyltransferase family 2 protein n=1 Tax=Gordonibacter massiliensis (ex Traore et al. 2017) TaxID=1841863 RepID=UPI001C8CA144|nr:glycosyltransferase family 2 protein [Gordonibacter massiliensis (ex Traore et al. 2017)]MBX9033642.1 glycosyltransferase family 2 protein [Gordonibacter massiliensis (ex Traore et al. 2017)]